MPSSNVFILKYIVFNVTLNISSNFVTHIKEKNDMKKLINVRRLNKKNFYIIKFYKLKETGLFCQIMCILANILALI